MLCMLQAVNIERTGGRHKADIRHEAKADGLQMRGKRKANLTRCDSAYGIAGRKTSYET